MSDTQALTDSGRYAAIAATVGATPATLRAWLVLLPTALIETPLDGDWSPKDVVAHLVDVDEHVFLDQLTRILEEAAPAFAPIDPTARLAAGGYRAQPLEELLDRLDVLRAADANFIASLDRASLHRTASYQGGTPFTAAQLLAYWAYHDNNHLAQLGAMLRTAFGGPDGAHVSETFSGI